MKKQKRTTPAKPQLGNNLQIQGLVTLEDEDRYEGFSVSKSSLEGSCSKFITFKDCVLSHVSFRNAEIENAKFVDVRFENCDLSNSFWPKLSLNRVEFISCRMTGMRLPESRLANVLIQDCKCDILQAPLSTISTSRFQGSNLTESDFRQAKLDDLEFAACILAAAEFYDSKLKQVDFRTSKIEGLKISPESWRGAIIDSSQLIAIASELAALWGIRVDE